MSKCHQYVMLFLNDGYASIDRRRAMRWWTDAYGGKWCEFPHETPINLAHEYCLLELLYRMFYSSFVLASMLVGVSAFAPMAPSRRFGTSVLQMEADPWNTEANGKNYVDMATLE